MVSFIKSSLLVWSRIQMLPEGVSLHKNNMIKGLWKKPCPRYRFSAFWLRSKCSICSYQLNIWYEVHRTSSILNWFLAGDEVSVACYGFVACRPCIAVPQGFWHTSPLITFTMVSLFSINLNDNDDTREKLFPCLLIQTYIASYRIYLSFHVCNILF